MRWAKRSSTKRFGKTASWVPSSRTNTSVWPVSARTLAAPSSSVRRAAFHGQHLRADLGAELGLQALDGDLELHRADARQHGHGVLGVLAAQDVDDALLVELLAGRGGTACGG